MWVYPNFNSKLVSLQDCSESSKHKRICIDLPGKITWDTIQRISEDSSIKLARFLQRLCKKRSMGLCALEISKAEGWPYAVRLASFIGDSDLVVRISSVGDADLDPVLGSNRSLVNKAAIGRSLLGPGILDSYPFCRRRSPICRSYRLSLNAPKIRTFRSGESPTWEAGWSFSKSKESHLIRRSKMAWGF